MNPQHPDLFPERPVRSDFGRGPSYRTRRIITVSVVVIALAVGARMIFGGSSILPPGEIATIKGEGPWKKRPDQPGGIDIPNQDVQVYQALDGKDGKPPIEHLLPPPETPQNTPVSPAAPNGKPAASPVAPQVESLIPPKLDIDTITPPASTPPEPVATTVAAPPATAPVPAAAPVAAIEAAPAPTPAPAPAPPVVHTAPAKPKPARTIEQVLQDVGAPSKADASSKTGRIVQLASVQDEASAQDMAQNLQSKYASILGSTPLRVVRAEVAGKGVYYRIQSPSLSDDRATSICDAIKKTKAGCILVRP